MATDDDQSGSPERPIDFRLFFVLLCDYTGKEVVG